MACFIGNDMNKFSVLLLCALYVLCACEPKVNLRGNLSLADNVDTFVVGKTTVADVVRACGSPSIQKDNFVWIYSGWRSEELAFRNVDVKDKMIVRMAFDKNGVLKSLDKIKSENDKNSKIITDDVETQAISEKEAEAIVKNGLSL